MSCRRHVTVMESAGKRRRSRTDDSFISAFTALRDSSITQTGPKRPREGGVWNFTPDPPLSKRRQRKSSPRKSNSLLRSTLKNARSRSVAGPSELTPHTDMVETVKEFIETGAKVRDLIPLKPASSTRYQLTPTPVISSPVHRTRSSTRRSIDPSSSVPETPPTHNDSSSRILEGLSSISKPLSRTASVDEQHNISEQSLSPIQPSSSNVDNSTKQLASPLEEVGLEPLDNEEEEEDDGVVDEMEQDGDEEIDELDNVGVHKEVSPEVGSQAVISNEHSDGSPRSARKTSKQKQPSQTKHKLPKTLPRPLIKNLFTLFSKKRLTKDAMDLVMKFSELYLKQASTDLAAFASHAGRKTLEVNDVVLLLHRQRALTHRTPFEYLVNTHLPMEYSQELLPCAMGRKTPTPSAT